MAHASFDAFPLEPLELHPAAPAVPIDASILVIDDDAVHARTVADGLESEGYKVEVATSGEDGLRRLEDGEWDLVVTDLVMRGANGFDVLKAARERDPAPEVSVVTGHGSV